MTLDPKRVHKAMPWNLPNADAPTLADAYVRLTAEKARLRAALEGILPLAEQWANGKGRSHPDHEWIAEARAALSGDAS